MTTFQELIRNHYVINLDERNDRLISYEKELKKIGLDQPRRYSAIKNKVGIVGCGLSHLACLLNAKDADEPYVCIFEDDIIIPKPNQVKNIVNRILDAEVEWDVLLLAGSAWRPHKKEEEDYTQVLRCYCGTGYIVKREYYDTLILNIREGLEMLMKTGDRVYSWDAHWILLQRVDKFIMIKPLSIYQMPDHSDIEEQYVNYKALMLSDTK